METAILRKEPYAGLSRSLPCFSSNYTGSEDDVIERICSFLNDFNLEDETDDEDEDASDDDGDKDVYHKENGKDVTEDDGNNEDNDANSDKDAYHEDEEEGKDVTEDDGDNEDNDVNSDKDAYHEDEEEGKDVTNDDGDNEDNDVNSDKDAYHEDEEEGKDVTNDDGDNEDNDVNSDKDAYHEDEEEGKDVTNDDGDNEDNDVNSDKDAYHEDEEEGKDVTNDDGDNEDNDVNSDKDAYHEDEEEGKDVTNDDGDNEDNDVNSDKDAYHEDEEEGKDVTNDDGDNEDNDVNSDKDAYHEDEEEGKDVTNDDGDNEDNDVNSDKDAYHEDEEEGKDVTNDDGDNEDNDVNSDKDAYHEDEEEGKDVTNDDGDNEDNDVNSDKDAYHEDEEEGKDVTDDDSNHDNNREDKRTTELLTRNRSKSNKMTRGRLNDSFALTFRDVEELVESYEPEKTKTTEAYEDFFIKNNILFKYEDGKEVLAIPKIMQTEVIRSLHEVGHFAVTKTQDLIRRVCYIPNLGEKIEHCIGNCVKCILGSKKEVIECVKRHQKDFGNPLRIISDRGTVFTAKEFEDYCEQRSIKSTPFEVLFGTKMKNKEDLRMEIREQEIIKQFDEDREMLRNESRRQLVKIQEENRRKYDLRRKRPRMYKKGDLVAINQFGGGLKLLKKYLGPCVVVQVNPNDSYEVKKPGYHGGLQSTLTCAEYMESRIGN
uniref:RNA-directed DNA polymerase n=1 Tax=Diabrotica virgifera virgifera TaxID=50390 RepID=A0A6P7GAT6_DIAVI